MRILTIPHTYGLTKPSSGGQNRFFNLANGLRRMGHEIIVLETLDNLSPEDSGYATTYGFKEREILGRSLAILRDTNWRFVSALSRIVREERPDIVEFAHPSGMLAAHLVIRDSKPRIPLMYNAQNVEAEFALETMARNDDYTRLERAFVTKYTAFLEQFVCRHVADHIVVCSSKDAQSIASRYGIEKPKISVVRSGGPSIQPADPGAREAAKKILGFPPEIRLVLFHGIHSLFPNREAVELIRHSIAPVLFQSNPDVRFVIVGSGMPVFTEDNVQSLGYVPSLSLPLRAADVAIVPLKSGAGVKLKVLDYMAAGLPMVTTRKGIEGIDARNREEAIIVDSVDQEFVRELISLINNPQERERLGRNARILASAQHDWVSLARELSTTYLQILKASS